ncbi:phosphotransferase [Leifsonia poae]|uniref:phosphotransferase n=1 Tax=Leifsonia poae TaxID=110933 RepID=UPI001CBF7F52|nr:phosphotransferase [Leifsonia poae]
MVDSLPGGNMNVIHRDGDTVRRIAGPWTPTVHRYLAYIARNGVDWAPRPKGIEGDREVLSFIEGTVPVYPLPEWVWADSIAVEGARRLRQLHDASIGFGLDGAIWQSPTKVPAEVICHNDFSPHNLAFRDGEFFGAIDFDMCSPGPRLWDIAYFATRVVPLTGEAPPGAPGWNEIGRRLDLILAAYGSVSSRGDVVRLAITRLHDLAEHSVRKAEELGKPALRDDAEYYEREAVAVGRLLTDPQFEAN